jgi:hypothetical protein
MRTVSTRLKVEDCTKLRQYASKLGFQSTAAFLRFMITSRLYTEKSTKSTRLIEESIDNVGKIKTALSQILEETVGGKA